MTGLHLSLWDYMYQMYAVFLPCFSDPYFLHTMGPISVHWLSETLSFVLLKDTWSQWGHSVSCMTILWALLANQQSRCHIWYQATSNMARQLGDCRCPLSSSGVCVGMHRLTYTHDYLWGCLGSSKSNDPRNCVHRQCPSIFLWSQDYMYHDISGRGNGRDNRSHIRGIAPWPTNPACIALCIEYNALDTQAHWHYQLLKCWISENLLRVVTYGRAWGKQCRLVPRRPYIPHPLPLCINCRD